MHWRSGRNLDSLPAREVKGDRLAVLRLSSGPKLSGIGSPAGV
jgi:hypothetical protein